MSFEKLSQHIETIIPFFSFFTIRISGFFYSSCNKNNMKTIILFLCVLFMQPLTFGQNKKDLLREIEKEKRIQIEKATFQVDYDTLILAIKDYLSVHGKGWSLDYKQNEISGWKPAPFTCTEMSGYPVQSKTKMCQGKELLTINLQIKSDKGYVVSAISRTEKATCPCAGMSSGPSVTFKSGELKKYLYDRFPHQEFALSEDLGKKIETYNSGQKKDKKKILKGIDY